MPALMPRQALNHRSGKLGDSQSTILANRLPPREMIRRPIPSHHAAPPVYREPMTRSASPATIGATFRARRRHATSRRPSGPRSRRPPDRDPEPVEVGTGRALLGRAMVTRRAGSARPARRPVTGPVGRAVVDHEQHRTGERVQDRLADGRAGLSASLYVGRTTQLPAPESGRGRPGRGRSLHRIAMPLTRVRMAVLAGAAVAWRAV